MFLKYAYVVFIGVLLATFLGVGISVFYPEPDSMQNQYYRYDVEPKPASDSAQLMRMQQTQEENYKIYQDLREAYERNVSILALGLALITVIISLTLIKNLSVIADGVLLGGVLTLGYSIIRGFSADDDIYRFLVTGVGLIVAIALGYLKIVRPHSKTK